MVSPRVIPNYNLRKAASVVKVPKLRTAAGDRQGPIRMPANIPISVQYLPQRGHCAQKLIWCTMTRMVPARITGSFRAGAKAVFTIAFLVPLLGLAPLFGQALQMAPVMGAPGEVVNLEISWQSPEGGVAASSLQWDTVFPAQLVEVAGGIEPETGPAGVNSGKTLTCAPSKTYSYSCKLAGGQKPIPNGVIAVLRFKIKPDARAGSSAFRTEKGEAVSINQGNVDVQTGEALIIVRAFSGGSAHPGGNPTDAIEPPASGAPESTVHATAAYLVLEPYLHEIHEAWQSLDYKRARELLIKAQEALWNSEVAASKGVPASPPPLESSLAPKTAEPASPATHTPQPTLAATATPPTDNAQVSNEPSADNSPAGQHNQRGRELINQHKYKEAIEELSQALDLRHDFAQALNARGFAFYMLKQYADSLRDLNEAIHLNPKYQNAYRNRAAVHAAMGDTKSAAEDKARARQSK